MYHLIYNTNNLLTVIIQTTKKYYSNLLQIIINIPYNLGKRDIFNIMTVDVMAVFSWLKVIDMVSRSDYIVGLFFLSVLSSFKSENQAFAVWSHSLGFRRTA